MGSHHEEGIAPTMSGITCLPSASVKDSHQDLQAFETDGSLPSQSGRTQEAGSVLEPKGVEECGEECGEWEVDNSEVLESRIRLSSGLLGFLAILIK